MSIKSFLKLVEIQTKVASILPFLLGISYTLFAYGRLDFINVSLMFLSMLIFDMATTATNNYMDYKKALKKKGFGYEIHNAIVRDNLNPSNVKVIIALMILLASVLGIFLFSRTNIIVLFLGIISFIIGLLYSTGPIPISRTPFGEIFSGLTMGFIITFLTIYINIFDSNIILLSFSSNIINISIDLYAITSIFIVTVTPIVGISNIMLANNICDIQDDLENKRYTLPIYLGKKNSLTLFKILYLIGFLSILLGSLLKILPWTSLFTFILLKKVMSNIAAFEKLHTKKDTFILAVQNFVLVNLVYIVSILLGILLK